MKNFLNRICLFVFLFCSSLSSENKTFNFKENKKKVAICYFGLTRTTKKVYPSHFGKIFNILKDNHIEYDVFMHTWDINGKQKILKFEIDNPIDYEEHKLLNPKYYKIENQNDFISELDFDQYFYRTVWDKIGDEPFGEWLPELILNHLCALESQKRVTEMVEHSGNDYDFVIYLRPDAWFKTKLPISSILSLKDNEILIPNFDHFEGYNDRFAILTYKTAPLYGKRIDQIIDFRKNQGRIVSEKYVKYICDKNGIGVRFIDFYFDLIRP